MLSPELPIQVVQTENGHTRVYPFLADMLILRTKERMIERAEEAVKNNTKLSKEVKNLSVCALIPKFNAALTFVPDHTHATLERILKMLILLWLSSKYRGLPFYIRKNKGTKSTKSWKIFVHRAM